MGQSSVLQKSSHQCSNFYNKTQPSRLIPMHDTDITIHLPG